MNYIKDIEQAIQLFNQLEQISSKKEKISFIENIKGNEVAEKLVELLKAEKVKIPNFELNAVRTKNSGAIRLSNYLRFIDGLNRQEDKLDENVIAYRLRNIDEDEVKMYKAILTKSISIPTDKEEAKVKASKKAVKAASLGEETKEVE
ncbi:hypothetical protein ABFV99_13390 [Cytobacillus horneckiae]|uniref:hypothetical protein n=1 Tax=Cytobacillus horneckiae TaxID=549687 RepID=UPI0034CE41F7